MLLNFKKEHEINTYPLVWKDHKFFLQKSVVSSVWTVEKFSRKQVSHTIK